MTNRIDREYLDSHSYFKKIKEFVEKEYGGSMMDPAVFKEYYDNFSVEESEGYKALLTVQIHYEHEPHATKAFYIDYKYNIYTTGKIYEQFKVFKKIDNVYLESPEGKKHFKYE